MHILNLLSDNSEIVPYTIPSLPLFAKEEFLSHYPSMVAAMHWHNDLEFIIIEKGEMIYTVNSEEYVLREGDGIFINSQQLHGHHSIDSKECVFIGVLIPVQLLSFLKTIEEKYINTFCYDSNHSFLLLNHNNAAHNKIIENVCQIYHICTKSSLGFELETISYIYKLFHLLIHNTDFIVKSKKNENPWIDNLHQMIGYIQKNYTQKLSLQDIADSGNICRSKCCEIFKDIMHQTPNEYLTYYRISKSIELLKSTRLSMTDIALECGFSGSSYFAETFHKVMGCSPSQYKKGICKNI